MNHRGDTDSLLLSVHRALSWGTTPRLRLASSVVILLVSATQLKAQTFTFDISNDLEELLKLEDSESVIVRSREQMKRPGKLGRFERLPSRATASDRHAKFVCWRTNGTQGARLGSKYTAQVTHDVRNGRLSQTSWVTKTGKPSIPTAMIIIETARPLNMTLKLPLSFQGHHLEPILESYMRHLAAFR